MRQIDKFADPQLGRELVKKIAQTAAEVPAEQVQIMEVCGTHTVNIFRFGLRELLPDKVQLLSGPGCPVCVTPTRYIDTSIELAKGKDIIIATFGDMIKVPGSESSLDKEKATGADVRVCYSVTDALRIAKGNRQKEVVFLAVGFETTAPTIASAVKSAAEEKLNTFTILCSHKLIPPAMKLLITDPDVQIDGFLCPGHVSTIIGAKPYHPLAEIYRKPFVVAGFEPLDILQSILMVLTQLKENKPGVEIQYTRVVKENGNPTALAALSEVFDTTDSEWRGLGTIPESGLKLSEKYASFDAENRFDIEIPPARPDPRCICGDILKGTKSPVDCALFAEVCNPINPVGPCMVSTEGTCSAYLKYGKSNEMMQPRRTQAKKQKTAGVIR